MCVKGDQKKTKKTNYIYIELYIYIRITKLYLTKPN